MLTDEKVIKSDIRLCPLLNKDCIQDKCMLWVSFLNEDKTTFKTCAFVMNVQLAQQQVVEQIRTQAAMESVRNEFAKLTAIARQRALPGEG